MARAGALVTALAAGLALMVAFDPFRTTGDETRGPSGPDPEDSLARGGEEPDPSELVRLWRALGRDDDEVAVADGQRGDGLVVLLPYAFAGLEHADVLVAGAGGAALEGAVDLPVVAGAVLVPRREQLKQHGELK